MNVTRGGIAAAVAVVIVAAVCVRLGFWQLDRLEQRRAINVEVRAAISEPPLDLDSATFVEIAPRPGDFIYRRATARGRFHPEASLLLRGRAHQGRPGVHLVTPLELDSGAGIVLVNRGWLPSPDAATADPRPYVESETQTVTGTLRMIPHAGAGAMPAPIDIEDTTVTTFRRLDFPTLASRFDLPLAPVYLERTGEPDGLPAAVPPPSLDEGPHLGYALQWFGFAAVAIVGFLIVIIRRNTGPADPPVA
ncbi:MAG: SURF1 family protein [Gemmatimonadota bacterium]